MAKKKGLCESCNIYKEICNGKNLYIPKKTHIASKQARSCKNLTQMPNNTKSPIQVEAFLSLYKAKIRMGVEYLTAFIEAIVETSDDAFGKIKDKMADKIELYKELYGRKGSRWKKEVKE